MRRLWLVVPAALTLVSCKPLDTAASYRQAASQLTFQLERVEPRLEALFPLDRSRLMVRLVIRVNNPSEVRFQAKHVLGDLGLEELGLTHRLGTVDLPQGVELAPGTTSPLVLDLSFSYGDLRQNWPALTRAMRTGSSTTWRLDGKARMEAYGIPITVPFHARKTL